MNIALQWLIVAPLVLLAALFALWRLLSSRLRVRVLSLGLALLPQSGHWPLAQLRAAVMHRVALESASGCEACSRH